MSMSTSSFVSFVRSGTTTGGSKGVAEALTPAGARKWLCVRTQSHLPRAVAGVTVHDAPIPHRWRSCSADVMRHGYGSMPQGGSKGVAGALEANPSSSNDMCLGRTRSGRAFAPLGVSLSLMCCGARSMEPPVFHLPPPPSYLSLHQR